MSDDNYIKPEYRDDTDWDQIMYSHDVVDDVMRELAACVDVLHMMLMNISGYSRSDLADTFAALARYDALVSDTKDDT